MNSASANPVGTYQNSIVGTVTVIPPRVPTRGAIPISIPTAKAVKMIDNHAAMNKLAPRRFLLELPFKMNFTIKKGKSTNYCHVEDVSSKTGNSLILQMLTLELSAL